MTQQDLITLPNLYVYSAFFVQVFTLILCFFLLNPVTVHSETYLTQPFSGQQTLQFRRDSALKGLFIQEYIELAPQFIFRKEKNLVEIGLGLKGVTL